MVGTCYAGRAVVEPGREHFGTSQKAGVALGTLARCKGELTSKKHLGIRFSITRKRGDPVYGGKKGI